MGTSSTDPDDRLIISGLSPSEKAVCLDAIQDALNRIARRPSFAEDVHYPRHSLKAA